jgi:glycosyltransferase involved in cell wall biosynthesis
VLLIQHAIYPYRRPLFEALSREFDLSVVFCVHAKSFRRWDTGGMLDHPPFHVRVLPSLRLGRLVVNRGLVLEVLRGRYDVIVLGVIDLITLPQIMVLLARFAMATRGWVYRRAAAVAVWNQLAREWVVSCGVLMGRVFSGTVFFPDEARSAAVALAQPPRIVTLSYFLPRKGLDVLIRAFRRLDGDVRLVVAGSGEQEGELRAAAAGDDRIEFPGHLDAAAKEELLGGAYVFVLPTLWDPWGTVVNEAFYRRVPVVVTDAAGSAREVDGAGLVVPAGDVGALEEALRRIVADPEFRESLAAQTRGVVSRWTVEAQSEPLAAAIRAADRAAR